jgi:hypothetical protein
VNLKKELEVQEWLNHSFEGPVNLPNTNLLAKHYTGKRLKRLKQIYEKAGLKLL